MRKVFDIDISVSLYLFYNVIVCVNCGSDYQFSRKIPMRTFKIIDLLAE